LAMEFVAIVLLLLSPLGDLAYVAAIGGVIATVGSIIVAAIVKFAVLPAFETFPALCGAIGLILVPVGFATAQSRQLAAVLALLAFNFVAVLAPTNVMSYDTAQFYNTALGILAGAGAAALGFRLLPQLSPALRTRRLLALTLRDLRRLASATLPPRLDWSGRMIGRLAAVPDQAEPLQRARLLAALSVGNEIIQFRDLAPGLGITKEVATALEALAQGNSATAVAQLRELDRRLACDTDAEPEAAIALRMRARIGVIFEALSEHRTYFDTGAVA
jgi:uncharacterized membrane protein YccC